MQPGRSKQPHPAGKGLRRQHEFRQTHGCEAKPRRGSRLGVLKGAEQNSPVARRGRKGASRPGRCSFSPPRRSLRRLLAAFQAAALPGDVSGDVSGSPERTHSREPAGRVFPGAGLCRTLSHRRGRVRSWRRGTGAPLLRVPPPFGTPGPDAQRRPCQLQHTALSSLQQEIKAHIQRIIWEQQVPLSSHAVPSSAGYPPGYCPSSISTSPSSKSLCKEMSPASNPAPSKQPVTPVPS